MGRQRLGFLADFGEAGAVQALAAYGVVDEAHCKPVAPLRDGWGVDSAAIRADRDARPRAGQAAGQGADPVRVVERARRRLRRLDLDPGAMGQRGGMREGLLGAIRGDPARVPIGQDAQRTAPGPIINDLYELGEIGTRHEAFVRDGTVAHGSRPAQARQRKGASDANDS